MTEFIEQVFSTIFGDNVILATILIAIVPIIEIKGAIPFSMSSSIWGSACLTSMQALLYSLIGSCLIVPVLALIYIPIINALKRSKLFKKLALKIEEKVNRSKNKIELQAGRRANDITQKTFSLEENAKQPAQDIIKKDNKTIKEEQAKQNAKGEVKTSNLASNQNKAEVNIDGTTGKNNMFWRTQPYNKTFFIKLLFIFLFVSVPLPLTGVWTGTCVAVMLGLGFVWSCVAVILGNIVAGVLVTLVASIPGFDSIYIVYAVLVFIAVVVIISLIKKLINKKKLGNE